MKYLNVLSVLAIPMFLLGLTIALVTASLLGNYSIFFDTISELGSYAHTPFPIIINATFMISPFFLSFFFLKLFKIVRHHVKNEKHTNNLTTFGFSFFLISITILRPSRSDSSRKSEIPSIRLFLTNVAIILIRVVLFT